MEHLFINMLDKLAAINERYLEVEKLISSSNAMHDMKLYIQLSKEYKDLEPIIRSGDVRSSFEAERREAL